VTRSQFSKELEKDQTSLRFDLPDGEVFINGNGEQLNKVFLSLLGNSIYAVHKQAIRKHDQNEAYHPEVTLTVRRIDNHADVIIRDNGTGIEQAIIEKIFDPFFTTKTTSEASGIGLYLSHEIAQNHGGDIKVKSVKGQYTESTITLPTL
jgi:signal transduction histidine kinase